MATTQTPMGEQVLVDGTPRRAIPTTATRAKVPQADITETPLFGRERAARDAASDAAQLTIS